MVNSLLVTKKVSSAAQYLDTVKPADIEELVNQLIDTRGFATDDPIFDVIGTIEGIAEF